MSDPFEQLKNNGFYRAYDEACLKAKKKTLIVLGTARGGTSAPIGALDKLGVYTGKGSGKPVFEDVYLAQKIEAEEHEAVKSIIDEYNAEHDIWAYKRPRFLYFVKDFHHYFTNPIYIVIFRDLFSTAYRTKISGKVDIFPSLRKLLGDNEKIIDFLDITRPNALFVSYEKLIANPQAFVDELALLTGLEHTAEQMLEAVEFIQPAPQDYLDATRTNKCPGYIQEVEHDKVTGWARYNFPLNPPAELELCVNGKHIGTVTANLPRTDISPDPADKRADCAFRFDLPANSIKRGDRISVKADQDITELDNSPMIFKQPISLLKRISAFFSTFFKASP